MEDRIQKLGEFAAEARERLARIEARLELMATKADLQEMSVTLIKWIVGMVSGLGIAGITIMTFVLNNAVPKAPAPPVPVLPMVIQLPQQAPPSNPIPQK
jgi:hypothetical protein